MIFWQALLSVQPLYQYLVVSAFRKYPLYDFVDIFIFEICMLYYKYSDCFSLYVGYNRFFFFLRSSCALPSLVWSGDILELLVLTSDVRSSHFFVSVSIISNCLLERFPNPNILLPRIYVLWLKIVSRPVCIIVFTAWMTGSVVTLTYYFTMCCIIIFMEPDSKSNIKDSAIAKLMTFHHVYFLDNFFVKWG